MHSFILFQDPNFLGEKASLITTGVHQFHVRTYIMKDIYKTTYDRAERKLCAARQPVKVDLVGT